MAVDFYPTDAGIALFGVTLTLCILSTFTVILRMSVRYRHDALGLDDYLMVFGLIFYIACCTVTILGAFNGLGSYDSVILEADPSGQLMLNAAKWFFFYQITYVWSLPAIKASICVTLLRINKSKPYLYSLWFIIVLSTGTSFAGFIGAMLNCKPISAGWNPSAGSCDETGRILVLSKVISVAAIVTDWACAIIPAFIIWGLQMRLKQKIILCCILSLGVVASISTAIRFPYLASYENPVNQLHEFGIMCIWTMLECGLGIIAGSLPSLRPLLKKLGFTSSNKSYGVKRTGESTAGGSRGIPLSQLRTGHSSAAAQTKGGEWERIDDHSSQRNIIMKNTEIDIKWSEGSSV